MIRTSVRARVLVRSLAVGMIVVSLSAIAWADAIWTRSGDSGNAVELANIKVLEVKDGKLSFRATSGNKSERNMEQVVRMRLDDEPALNSAEEAYFQAKWETAADAYQKALKATGKEWVKDWVALRLIDSANKSERFDAALVGFITLAERDPGLALRNKPMLPEDKGSSFLELGVKELDKALANRSLKDDQKQALYSLLLEVHRKRDDAAAAAATLEQLTKLDPGAGSSAASGSAGAQVKLSTAMVALDSKDYKKALEQIEPNLALFTEPKAQADALFVIAEARYGMIGQEYDNAALKDAALAYMRVVAFFKNQPGAPHVAESLFKTGEILERLSEPREAMRVYQSVANEFSDSPLAPKAKAAIERIKAPKD